MQTTPLAELTSPDIDAVRPRRRKGVNERHDRALRCANAVRELQKEYREFSLDLERAIKRIRWQGRRTPEADRDRILELLVQYDISDTPAALEDLMEDSGFTRPETLAALDYLTRADVDLAIIVEKGGKTERARGRKQKYYRLNRRPQPVARPLHPPKMHTSKK